LAKALILKKTYPFYAAPAAVNWLPPPRAKMDNSRTKPTLRLPFPVLAVKMGDHEKDPRQQYPRSRRTRQAPRYPVRASGCRAGIAVHPSPGICTQETQVELGR
jgi:hypothetical protein